MTSTHKRPQPHSHFFMLASSSSQPMDANLFAYVPPSDTDWFNSPSFEKPDWNLEEPYFLAPHPYITTDKAWQEEQEHAQLHWVDCKCKTCNVHDQTSFKHPSKQ
jgi:hypothetical protein